MNIQLISGDDIKTGRGKGKIENDISVILTKKSAVKKEELVDRLGLNEKGKKWMEIKKTIRIPIHYDTTKTKTDILDRLTARITYGIRLIGELVSDVYGDVLINDDNDDNVKSVLKLAVIEEIVKDSDIIEKTGLSAGFIQQCINKVIWVFKSHRKLHKEWEEKVERAEERLDRSRDGKEREKGEKWLEKLMKREPEKPSFENKTSCRFDYRTGVVEEGKGKLSKLWIHISTLKNREMVDIPLNPSQYHINELKGNNVMVDDFEIIKGGNSRKTKDKYYIHISITKVVERKPINSIGGIDQGLNKSIAVVLLPLDGSYPREEQLLDSAKVELLEKYDMIISELQESEKWDKLRQMRGKREDISTYHDWCLAGKVAEFTEGSYLAIGNSKFRKGQFRGNQMPGLRKRIGKWSYGRQRKMISLKRSEMGYGTELRDEYGTSRECHICHSKLTRRIWGDGFSYIICHSCDTKIDADINAGYVIATRCRDDRLKAGMITMKNGVSL